MSSIVLYIIGVLTLVAGVGTIAFGIPINEFSFGNTLISAGASVAMGGLVVIALGAVIAELKRLGEAMNARAPAPRDVVDASLGGAAVPAPEAGVAPAAAAGMGGAFVRPLRPMAGAADAPSASASGELPPDRREEVRPTLRNPDLPPPSGEAAWPPAPGPGTASAAPRGPAGAPPTDTRGRQAEPRFSAGAGQPTRAAEAEAPRIASEPRPDLRPLPSAPSDAEAGPQRAPKVLKKGVVDGMAYTLYVDGSIEAELPQGTLRFASIHELRRYLESNA